MSHRESFRVWKNSSFVVYVWVWVVAKLVTGAGGNTCRNPTVQLRYCTSRIHKWSGLLSLPDKYPLSRVVGFRLQRRHVDSSDYRCVN